MSNTSDIAKQILDKSKEKPKTNRYGVPIKKPCNCGNKDKKPTQ